MSGFAPDAVVLVQEDTVYRDQRIDHAGRFALLGRKPAASATAGQPFLALQQTKSPDYSMFGDRFASVYADLSVIPFDSGVPLFQQPFALIYAQKPNRVDDPLAEDQTRRFNHGQIFSFIEGQVRIFGAFSIEIPDLCDDPWREYVRPTQPADLYPFRQIRTGAPPPPGQPLQLLWYQSPNLRIEAEIDGAIRRLDYGQAIIFARPQEIAPVVAGFRVMATQAGYYLGDYKDIGDVFDLATATDFSSSTVSQVPPTNPDYPVYGWMTQVPASTPLFSWAASGLSSPRLAPRRTVE